MWIQTSCMSILLISLAACGRQVEPQTAENMPATNTLEAVVRTTHARATESAAISMETGVPSASAPVSRDVDHTETDAAPTTTEQATPTMTNASRTEAPDAPEGQGAVKYVISADQSLVSYGVGETFLNQNNRFNYAVGTTNTVAGDILLNADNPSLSEVGPITVDISTFKSDKARRDKAIQGDWLESIRYPLALFLPAEIRALPSSYIAGDTLSFEIVGGLQVRDVIRETTFTLTVRLDGEQLIGTATTHVKMTDFAFSPPSIAKILEAENDVALTLDFIAVPAKP